MKRSLGFLLIPVAIILSGRSASASWPAQGAPVCVATGAQDSPVLFPDGSGGVFIAWSDSRAGGSAVGIYIQHLNAGGTALWTIDGKALSPSPQGQFAPQLASDDSGGVIVVWEDRRVDGGDIYAQRVDANGNIRWTAGGVPIAVTTNAQVAPVVVPDQTRGAFIAWEDTRSSANCTSGFKDIYAQRVNSVGAIQWAANGVPVCTLADDQDGVRAAPDGFGSAVLGWSDKRAEVRDVFAQTLTPAGTEVWNGNNDALVIRAADSQKYMDMAADLAGTVYFAWLDFRTLVPAVYVQRLDAAGSPMWGTAAVPAFPSAPGLAFPAPKIIAGLDGVMIAARVGPQVLAQYVNGDGIRQWPGGGVALSSPGLTPDFVGIVPDLEFGAIVGWVASPFPGNGDVYAQRVDPFGNSLWTANGVAVCTAAGNQDAMQVCADGLGGALLVWRDSRSGTTDIYAQRVDAGGVVGSAPLEASAPVPRRFGLRAAYPNPAHREVSLVFTLPTPQEVEMEVFDAQGRRMRHLLSGPLAAGSQRLVWDGRDDAGRPVASGAYLVRLTAGAEHEITALRLVR